MKRDLSCESRRFPLAVWNPHHSGWEVKNARAYQESKPGRSACSKSLYLLNNTDLSVNGHLIFIYLINQLVTHFTQWETEIFLHDRVSALQLVSHLPAKETVLNLWVLSFKNRTCWASFLMTVCLTGWLVYLSTRSSFCLVKIHLLHTTPIPYSTSCRQASEKWEIRVNYESNLIFKGKHLRITIAKFQSEYTLLYISSTKCMSKSSFTDRKCGKVQMFGYDNSKLHPRRN
jgi:hypothetical protein